MEAATDRVTEEALSLPVDARLKLVEKLLSSLNRCDDNDHDLLWAEEAERRVMQLEKGDAKLVAGDDVFARIRLKYAK